MEVVLYALSLILTVDIFVYQLLATTQVHMGFPGGSVVNKESAPQCRRCGSGRFPGEENGIPPQYSCLGNPMDKGGWWTTVHGIANNQIQLSK